jgi:hypothetical protein
MVTPPLRKHFERLGIPLIALDAGARAFVAEGAPADDTVILVGGASNAETSTPRGCDATFDLWVDRWTHPHLADHAIRGVPVVPIALAIEWFLRAMYEISPGQTPVLHALKVLRGIKLDPELRGDRLRIARRFVDGTWRLELRGSDDTLAYTATAEFGAVSTDRLPLVDVAGALMPDPLLYNRDVLFHGPAFQALVSLGAASDGLNAAVAGALDLGWRPEIWQTDPAATDGMLQIGLEFSSKLLGGATLPMAFQSFHLIEPGAAREQLRSTARAREVLNARAICDIALAKATGQLVAVLSGVEFILRPDGPATELAAVA